MAVRCVVFNQTLSGPTAGRDSALEALRAAGFEVRETECPYGDNTPAAEIGEDDDGGPVFESESERVTRVRAERAKTWLVADITMPQQPSNDNQTALMQRAADASSRYGFVLRLHGAGGAWRDSEGGH